MPAGGPDDRTASGWEPARTDMGVDWFVTRPLPVLAIGDAVILGSDSNDRGWPGSHFIWYQLLDGSHAGDVIYVAEHIKHLLPAGAHVRAGQKIAEALPGGTGTSPRPARAWIRRTVRQALLNGLTDSGRATAGEPRLTGRPPAAAPPR